MSNVLVLPGTNRSRYEQLPEESTEAFHGFTHYRDMGSERSVTLAYRQHASDCLGQDKSMRNATGTWTKWSDKHGWVERAVAYDQELDATKLDAVRSEAAEMGKRQALMAGAALEVLARPVLRFAEKLDEHPELLEAFDDADPMTMATYAQNISAALSTLAKMQRDAAGIGEVGEEQESHVTVEVVFEADPDFRL